MSWRADADPAGDRGAPRSASYEALAQAIAELEPLIVLCSPDDVDTVRARVCPGVEVLAIDGDDRRTLPAFVIAPDGVQAVLRGADTTGPPRPRRWHRATTTTVADLAGVPVTRSPLRLGSIRSDGWGTLLATESDLLDPRGGLTREQAEDELVAVTGALQVVWLPTGLGDPAEGHVDPVATFAAPGVVLVHDQPATGHPDHEVTAAAVAVLEAVRDSRGQRMRIVRVPAPARGRDGAGRWLHWSYLDHVLVNGGVVVPLFDDARDAEAVELLAEVHHGRAVVGVDARPLSTAGHGLRCCTVGQPAARAALERGARAGQPQPVERV